MREVWFNYYEICLHVTTFQIGDEGKGNTRTGDMTEI